MTELLERPTLAPNRPQTIEKVSIVISKGLGEGMAPGSLKGVQLVVADIHTARAQLLEHGVEVGEVTKLGENPVPGGHELDNVGFVFFDDPDGNSWAVQQISNRG